MSLLMAWVLLRVHEYHMVLDESARPVQHPPRRVPIAIREHLRETLEDFIEKREIIA